MMNETVCGLAEDFPIDDKLAQDRGQMERKTVN
jgi:hypothetical protein